MGLNVEDKRGQITVRLRVWMYDRVHDSGEWNEVEWKMYTERDAIAKKPRLIRPHETENETNSKAETRSAGREQKRERVRSRR